MWISYQDGVYDVTDFLKSHPGGAEKLMMAAGGAIDPFWQMYPFHKVQTVKELLEKYRIGDLHVDDRISEKDLPDFNEMQQDLTERSKKLVKMQDFPYCAETGREFLSEHFLTPNDEMYIRNHHVVP